MPNDYRGLERLSIRVERKVPDMRPVEKAVEGVARDLGKLNRGKLGRSIRREARRAKRARREDNRQTGNGET